MSKKLFRRRTPSIYSLSGGVKTKKSFKLRFGVLFAVVVSLAAMAAIRQYGDQLQSLVKTGQSKSVLAASPEKIIPLAKSIQTDGLSAPSTYLDDNLLQILQTWTDGHHGQDWSVSVQELDGKGRSASVRANSWYEPASIYKLYASYTLSNTVGFSNMDSRSLKVSGQKKTFRQCFEAMMLYSDNACGEAVAGYLGWWKIESDMHKLGLKNTYLNRKDTNFTTSEDANLFLQQLFRGKLFSAADQDYILRLMQRQSLRSGIPAGCEGCAVADKTGDLSNVRHDAAIIQSSGKTYVLTIFTSGARYSDIAALTKQINDYMTGNNSKY